MDIELRADVPLDAPPQGLPLPALVALCLDIWRLILVEDPRKAMSFLEALPRAAVGTPLVAEARAVTVAKIIDRPGPTGAHGGDYEPPDDWLRRRGFVGVTGAFKAPEQAILVEQRREAAAASSRPLDILIWTGNAWERWGPDAIDAGGIGGSETAAVKMAEELAALGHRVTVASDCAGHEGNHRGVRYLRQDHLWAAPKALGEPDVLVVSRQHWALPHFKAKVKLLWVHDIHAGDDSPQVRADIVLADRVLALSRWHAGFLRQVYPWLQASKIEVTCNSIDGRRFEAEPVKIGNRAVYASSPDRGLARLLELWPAVRARVPDAELHVCYGFGNWERMAKDYEPGLAAIAGLKRMIASTAGVVDRGRIGQRELAVLYLSAKVWAYPTWFTETSCISAMEAQAAACVPVTTRLAALEETVHHGTLLEDPCTSPGYGEAFVSEVARLMTDERARGPLAREARAAELGRGGWGAVARQWQDEIFLPLLKEKAEPLVVGGARLLPTPPSQVVEVPLVRTGDPGIYGARLPGGQAREISSVEISSVEISSVEVEMTPPALLGLGSTPSVPLPEAPPRRVKRWRPLRVAVTLGRLGAAVHGIMDVDDVADGKGSFRTGTVSGFFNIVHGLAERGHVVDAFADLTRSVAGSRLGGANFYRLDDAKPDDTYDGYISINEPDVLRDAPRNRFRAVAMWLNDFSFCAPGWDESVDLYVCPSRSLADYLKKTTATSPEKLSKVIPLGANLERFPPGVKKAPGTMIWASSPDRGLHHLLGMFPEIRARVPAARLAIYYRIDPWIAETLRREVRTEAEGFMLERASTVAAALSTLGRDGRGGVTVVGPVPPAEIARALSETVCFPYTADTTRYTEGFSVATLEACAAGCTPIISAIDALPEVYGEAVIMIPPTPADRRSEWIDAIVRSLTNEAWAAGVGERARSFSRAFSRQEVGRMWEELIRDRVDS